MLTLCGQAIRRPTSWEIFQKGEGCPRAPAASSRHLSNRDEPASTIHERRAGARHAEKHIRIECSPRRPSNYTAIARFFVYLTICRPILEQMGPGTIANGGTVIASGILLRSVGSLPTLYVGTATIGAGIAVGNVLLPSILKRDFPNRVAALTAGYVLIMGCTAALVSAAAVPVAGDQEGNWRLALVAAIILPVVAGTAWLPQVRRRPALASSTANTMRRAPIWRSAIAWQVTVFLGLDCFLYYVGVSWLQAILRDAQFSQEPVQCMVSSCFQRHCQDWSSYRLLPG